MLSYERELEINFIKSWKSRTSRDMASKHGDIDESLYLYHLAKENLGEMFVVKKILSTAPSIEQCLLGVYEDTRYHIYRSAKSVRVSSYNYSEHESDYVLTQELVLYPDEQQEFVKIGSFDEIVRSENYYRSRLLLDSGHTEIDDSGFKKYISKSSIYNTKRFMLNFRQRGGHSRDSALKQIELYRALIRFSSRTQFLKNYLSTEEYEIHLNNTTDIYRG